MILGWGNASKDGTTLHKAKLASYAEILKMMYQLFSKMKQFFPIDNVGKWYRRYFNVHLDYHIILLKMCLKPNIHYTYQDLFPILEQYISNLQSNCYNMTTSLFYEQFKVDFLPIVQKVVQKKIFN